MNKAHKPFRIGLIGTGRISDIYIQNCSKFDELEIVSCGSLDAEESKKKAQVYGIPRVQSPEEIIADFYDLQIKNIGFEGTSKN